MRQLQQDPLSVDQCSISVYVLQRKIALAYLGEYLFEASPLGYEVVALRDPLEDPLEASPLGRKVVLAHSRQKIFE